MTGAAQMLTVRVPLAIRHRPGRKTVLTPVADGIAPVTTRADATLVKGLAGLARDMTAKQQQERIAA